MSEAGDAGHRGSHSAPAVRLCEIIRPASGGSCGFHLSRTKWDPYPWVGVVEDGSAAQRAGLQVGDCVLEVNGEDVVGQKISEIADRVRSRPDAASLLVWNCGSDGDCDPEALCCGPMPVSLKRMSSCLAAVLGALECPVCLDTIPPPAHQCFNGHLMCAGCRARAERCPVCRVRLYRGRSLLSDQVFLALTDTFNVSAAPREEQSAQLRQKLLVPGADKKKKQTAPELKVSFLPSVIPANKFLTKLMGKSSSLNNLAAAADAEERNARLSAVPRHMALSPETSSQLKVKSLSTSEINGPLDSRGSSSLPPSPNHSRGPSPRPSRAPSPNPGSRSPNVPRAAATRLGSGLLDAGFLPLGSSQRPASCHSSLESLMEAEPGQQESLYRCPWSDSCALRLPPARLVSHGRAHGGPLLLAFRPHCDLALPLPGPLCVQLPDRAGQPRELFVDARRGPQGERFLRAWLAGSPEDCRCWRLSVAVHAEEGSPAPPTAIRVRSLSVEADDLRRQAAVVEDDNDVAEVRLPADGGRLTLDFVVLGESESSESDDEKPSATAADTPDMKAGDAMELVYSSVQQSLLAVAASEALR